jgi:hypothetical protein
MKRTLTAALILAVFSPCAVEAQSASPLTLQRTIELPAGTAKFDHFAIDLKTDRLYIAATGNHSVEVLDLGTGKVVESVSALGKPHGLFWNPSTNSIYAADGSQGDLKIFTGTPLRQSKAIKLSDDADDMVFDAKTGLLYVGHGGGDAANPGSIAVIDTATNSLLGNLPVTTHPEGLEIDNATDRIFVNVADAAQIAVIDGATHKQSATWKLTRAKDNVPLAYDEEHQVLFVACRTPSRLLVLDGNSGKELADLPSDSGADDLYYDAELHRVYLIAGSGDVDTYGIEANKAVHAIGVTHTSPGAKTGLFVSSQHALYIGAAANAAKPASILVYSTK